MIKRRFIFWGAILLIVCMQFLSACGSFKELDKDENEEFISITIENFSFEIPSYWIEDEKTEDSVRYYSERENKVAMLEFYYGVDTKDVVTWQMLYDEREKLISAIENSMSEMECKVSGYEEVVSTYGEKGILYKYKFSTTIDNSENEELSITDDIVENVEPYELAGEGYWYCLPSEEDNRWFFINCGFTENVEYKNYSNDFLKLISSAKCNVGSNDEKETTEKLELTVTMDENDFKGLTIAEAKNALKEMGFFNFEYQTLNTEEDESLNGKIGGVEIKKWKFGKGDFSKGDIYKSDAIVVLWSYEYTEPKKPDSVFYSTNDYENATKGNTGVFSYKSTSGSYDIYWIIDFDAGYVYYFTEGNGNDTCDRLKIQTGDLNDKIVVTYHDGGDSWSYGLHFKYVNHPETLIMNDNDGFEYKYSTTDLEDALNLRDKKTIQDY